MPVRAGFDTALPAFAFQSPLALAELKGSLFQLFLEDLGTSTYVVSSRPSRLPARMAFIVRARHRLLRRVGGHARGSGSATTHGDVALSRGAPAKVGRGEC